MSALDDITSNSDVYSLSNVSTNRAVRNAVIANLAAGETSKFLEIAHTPGTGNRPNRRMIKAGTLYDFGSSRGGIQLVSLHMVMTIPKVYDPGTDPGFFSVHSNAYSLADVFYDPIFTVSSGKFPFLEAVASGLLGPQ
jgi:hypothetical protein